MGVGTYNYAFDGQGEKLDSDPQKAEAKLRAFSVEGNESAVIKDEEALQTEKKEDLFRGRRFIVEPAFFMMFIFHFTSFTVTQQYVYYAIGEKYNLSALLKAAKEDSLRNNGTGQGICGKVVDEATMNTTAYKTQQFAQAETARFNFYMDLIGDIPVVFVMLFFGTLMDKVGRKPALIFPLIGVILRAFIYVIQMVFQLPVEFIWLTGITDALSGGLGTFFGACFAIYADTIPAKNRGRRIIIADVFYSLSAAVVGLCMGVVIDRFGFLVPFFWMIPGHFINLMYIIFFIPETGKKSTKKVTISPKYILQSFKVFKKKREGNGRKCLYIIVSAYLLFGFTRGAMKQETIYKLNSPFCWTSSMMGAVGSASTVVMSITQIFTATCLIKWLGEINCIIVSLTSAMVDQIVTGVAQNTWQLLIGIFVGAFQGSSMSLIRSTMSQVIGRNEQGSLNSCLSAAGQLLGLVSSFTFANIYAETLYVYKGTVFLIAGCILGIVILHFAVFKHYSRPQDLPKDVIIVEANEEKVEEKNSVTNTEKKKEAHEEDKNVYI